MGTLLQDGIDAAKSGHMEEALQLLRRSAEENPRNADVWVWLSAIIDDEEKQTEFLQKALEIDPENKPAQRGMAFLKRKKFIAPKPGETLSDHTRPIGVFKAGAEKPAVQQPLVPLVPMTEQASDVPAPIEASEYDPDTESTIPPGQTNEVLLEGQLEEIVPEEETKAASSDNPEVFSLGDVASHLPNVGDLEIIEEIEKSGDSLVSSEPVSEEVAQAVVEAQPGDQATQVSAVIASSVEDENPEPEEDTEPELDQELQVSTSEPIEEVSPLKVEDKPNEHPLITEAKRLKWQLLLYGLILTAFIIIGILVGSTLKNLISPQKQRLSMNIEPIAKQNGIFLLEGQQFLRLNILKEFPKEDVGLVMTDLDLPQVILKDQMVTETAKLKLLDANQSLVASQIKMLGENIPILEPVSSLNPGRYCISYVLGTSESQAMYWCFLKK